MISEKTRRFLGRLLLALSLPVLIWGLWPFRGATRSISLSLAHLSISSPVAAAQPPGSLPVLTGLSARRLELQWPSVLRAGDPATIRLSLEEAGSGGLATSSKDTGLDLYDSHNVLVEARLDLAGMQVVPASETNEPLRPGRPVTFFWSLRPQKAGGYPAMLWLHLRFIPLDGDRNLPESRGLLSAQKLDLQATSLMGLSGPAARAAGSTGLALGLLFGMDNYFMYLWKQVRKVAK